MLLFWGITLGMVGKILLGIAVLRVHMGIFREHKIDDVVLKTIKRERTITYIALLLIVIGYGIEMIAFGYLPTLSAW